mmetsp:Transcript_30819/g.94485  ORF Transcript_30819/g.94485 Transcript_30819/m.94485 type:complete len:132 (+) Transcript_30819:458-853(+)|eukprot:scaffold329629_cov52-Tisochrysis_lutea.AAC.1
MAEQVDADGRKKTTVKIQQVSEWNGFRTLTGCSSARRAPDKCQIPDGRDQMRKESVLLSTVTIDEDMWQFKRPATVCTADKSKCILQEEPKVHSTRSLMDGGPLLKSYQAMAACREMNQAYTKGRPAGTEV